jgi:hypothetical protein
MKTRILSATAAVVLFAAIPTLSQGASHVLVPGCGGKNHAAFEPSKIIVACGDGNLFMTKLKWSSWGSKSARGKGTAHENTCSPSCAQGHFKSYPVSIKLSKPKLCTKQHETEFKVLTYTFTSTKPRGVPAKNTVPRPCSS